MDVCKHRKYVISRWFRAAQLLCVRSYLCSCMLLPARNTVEVRDYAFNPATPYCSCLPACPPSLATVTALSRALSPATLRNFTIMVALTP